jgi:hypothetical protein
MLRLLASYADGFVHGYARHTDVYSSIYAYAHGNAYSLREVV